VITLAPEAPQQLDLFAQAPTDDGAVVDLDAVRGLPVATSRTVERCGQCVWMECALPGCYDGKSPHGSRDRLGRCTNPSSPNFAWSEHATRACPVTGRLPEHGSWAYVSSISVGCDAGVRR
jgi:hypothetical protein